MAVISNGRDRALVIESTEQGLELTIEDEQGGECVGIVFPEREQMIDVFHELVTVMREMGAEINLKFT